MKIVKRDGRTVDYDPSKILIAIQKSNSDVEESKRISENQIYKIINYIESLGKKRILVEDIQDIIEQKLMEYKKYDLAKNYIIYRYNRSLIRKSNNTDEFILGVIKNQNKQSLVGNKNCAIASLQRDIVAGEISKDITRRVLLPEKIIKAHDDGIIYFHDMDYFIHSTFNACYVNIKDMLDNGTVMNQSLIESPKSFQVACNVTTQIFSQVGSGQCGPQTINVSCLSPYLKKSYEKIKKRYNKIYKNDIDKDLMNSIIEDKVKTELRNGIQTLLYQTNTLMTARGTSPSVTLFLYLDKNDKNISESAEIINEIITQYQLGIKDVNGNYKPYDYPKIVYVLTDNNQIGKKYGYITENVLNSLNNVNKITLISELKMKELFNDFVFGPVKDNMFMNLYKKDGSYLIDGRFVEGVVSVNVASCAIDSNGAEKKFFELLDERMELAYEALICRYRALLNVSSGVSPIHWQYGAITRIDESEKIDDYLKDGYANLVLGYAGLDEASHIIDADNKMTIKTKILHFMNEKIKNWNKDNNLGVILYCDLNVGSKFVEKDLERFGLIKNITDKDSYDLDHELDLNNYQDQVFLQTMSKGGYGIWAKASTVDKNLLSLIYENIWYIEIKR